MFHQDHLAQHHKMQPRWDDEVLKGCRLPSRNLQSIGEERQENFFNDGVNGNPVETVNIPTIRAKKHHDVVS